MHCKTWLTALLFTLATTQVDAKSDVMTLEELSFAQLQQLVDDKKISYQHITQYYLSRIAELDDSGPKLNAIISLNTQALDIAKQRDAQHSVNKAHSLLFGMPIVLKDNIETSDNMPTTAGAIALSNNYAKNDAELVKKLKASGAIILGKANLSEWANFKSTQSSSGWSDIGGQTKNPYVLNRTPCGSSSGSAVAVAANLAVAAIGTETDGSITCPAAHNALVGLKPTVGLVSGKGVIPLSHSQDAPGPMTRNVQDAAILLEVLSGSLPNSYQKHLKADGLKGKRLGVVRNISEFNSIASKAFAKTLDVLEREGAIVIDDLTLDYQDALSQAEFDILLYDFKHDIEQYLANTPEQVKVKSLAELIKFNKTLARSDFNQGLLEMANNKGDLQSEVYLAAKKLVAEKARKRGIDALLAEHNLDAIVAPTNGPAWVIDTLNGDHYTGASSSPAAIAGYPSITIPMAFYRNLPLGISFFSGANSEATLIEIGYAFEQATQIRKAPEFLKSIDE
ncbi:amidase [Pseudoalteromonas sp. A25]|uniref:amidase n=1 Tax=Pseudoalteromonas sp. A25 TaxID=116092 RepID=UPI001260BD02|nr:amidase [Pseudoalteromonas sp. A25]BBN83933.1 amidase [Pseudoalteromonas sp. A25]